MKKIRKNVAGVIVVSMLVGSNVVSLAAYDKQVNKISEYKEVNKNRIKQLEGNNRSLRDEVFDKNKQLHKQVEEIKDYKIDINDLKSKNSKLKQQLEEAKKSVESRPSEPTHQVQVSRGEEDNKVSYQMQMTSYTAFCDTGCTGITATGIDVRGASTYEGKRIIAVDPAVVPLWSEVELRYADGRTERAIALDTGGDIKNSRIDLLVADESTAWAFGRQPVELRIVNEGKR